jgi:hypothetical protein
MKRSRFTEEQIIGMAVSLEGDRRRTARKPVSAKQLAQALPKPAWRRVTLPPCGRRIATTTQTRGMVSDRMAERRALGFSSLLGRWGAYASRCDLLG